MTIVDPLVTVFLAAGAVVRAAEARRRWRDAAYWRTASAGIWLGLLGRRAARGADRAVVAQTVVLASAALMMAGTTAARSMSGLAAHLIQGIGAVAGVCGIVLGTGLGMAIILANWPRRLVPPPSRHEGGLLRTSRAQVPGSAVYGTEEDGTQSSNLSDGGRASSE